MSRTNEDGEIEDIYEEKEIEWKITETLAVLSSLICELESPTFCFSNCSWYFRLTPNCTDHPNGAFCLVSTNPLQYSVKFDFGLKKTNNNIVNLGSGIFEKNKKLYHVFDFKPSEAQKLDCERTSSKMLTFWCTLKCERSLSNQPRDKPNSKKLIKLDTLSTNFKNLISNKESCDITLHVQDKEYKAHRAVLIARSSVFAAMFLHDTSEKKTGIVTIPDCDAESFQEFLEFLYTGKFENPSFRNALYLYETSDKYEVEELKAFCVEYLMENLSVENVCDVVVFADKYEEVNLLSAAQDFFNKNLDEIFYTSEWDSLVKNNYRLSKQLLQKMSSKMKVVE